MLVDPRPREDLRRDGGGRRRAAPAPWPSARPAGPRGSSRWEARSTRMSPCSRIGDERGPLAATAQGADPRQQLVEGERLAQVIVGPGVEPADAVGHGVAGRQEEDGRLAARLRGTRGARPSRPGRGATSRARRGPTPSRRARARPSSPSAACSTANPSSRSPRTTKSAISGSSSTTRMRRLMVPRSRGERLEPPCRVGPSSRGSPEAVQSLSFLGFSLLALLVVIFLVGPSSRPSRPLPPRRPS